MLCDNCQKHFDFSKHDYRYVKERTIAYLEARKADYRLLELLHNDLVEYRLSKELQSPDICPWLPIEAVVDFLETGPVSVMKAPELWVLDSECTWEDLMNSGERGCAMCQRICAAIETLRR